MKPVPLWRRIAARPSWERGDPPRWSDFDPAMPIRAALNRLAMRQNQLARRQQALLDRLERSPGQSTKPQHPTAHTPAKRVQPPTPRPKVSTTKVRSTPQPVTVDPGTLPGIIVRVS